MVVEKLAEVTKKWFDENVEQFNQEITNEFLNQAHLSPQTLSQYRSALYHFFKFVHDQCGNKSITDLKPRDALRYQNFLINRNLSSSAVKFKRSSVSSLCGYIELYYSDEFPLFRNIYNKKIPNPAASKRHEKVPLTEEEFFNLIEVLTERKEYQMVAYLLFTYETGCRRGESRQLLRDFVNAEKAIDKKTGEEKPYYFTSEIRCKGRGKEGKLRKFPVSEIAMEALKKWHEERGEDDCPYMFVKKTKEGKVNQLSASTFNYWCTEIFTEIVGKRVHPHLLRSSKATNLSLYGGKSIDAIQALLGHNSPDTTKIYIVKDGEDELDELYE
ncbi:tyrosine-type recombinase/integrase [Metabacillus fastidiosus]|uniref:tyrosine-type recombinase/integrase n=1 Tax=Metabacillus fastidiosus TaxID=1458 RepID=UPI003D2A47E8